MGSESRRNGVAFRRAVWASLVLHTVAAFALVWLVRSGDGPKPREPGIDTRSGEPLVRMSLTEETVVSLDVAPHPSAVQEHTSAKPEFAATPQPTELAAPLAAARPAPQPLPPAVLNLIRMHPPQPAGGAVEVPVSPGAANAAVTNPNVRPAGGANPAVPAIHGALRPNQTVVYVLDCSGSMGAGGKFDAARAALLATLKQQPATVRFQVIVYASAATPLLVSDGGALPATETNVRAAADKLAALAARGPSNHLGAVRAALAFRPDVILLLTDGDDLTAAALKPVLASAPRPATVCLGQVTAAGVQRPRELK